MNKELRKDYVENFVLDSLYNNLFSDMSIKKLSVMLTEYHQKQEDDSKDELDTATAELANVTAKINGIIRLVVESGISPETVGDNLRELEENKIYLEKRIRELTLHKRESRITEEVIAGLIVQSREFVKTKNLAECRQFIKTYINKVVVHGESVEVIFNINIPNEAADGVEPIVSEEGIKAIRREFKGM